MYSVTPDEIMQQLTIKKEVFVRNDEEKRSCDVTMKGNKYEVMCYAGNLFSQGHYASSLQEAADIVNHHLQIGFNNKRKRIGIDPTAVITWIGNPRKENYEEHHKYHRKSIWVKFKLKGDDNLYNFEAQNILFENGQRRYYYEIQLVNEEENMLEDIGYAFENRTISLMDRILSHPNMRLHAEWLKIDKDPSKIGYDGLFRENK